MWTNKRGIQLSVQDNAHFKFKLMSDRMKKTIIVVLMKLLKFPKKQKLLLMVKPINLMFNQIMKQRCVYIVCHGCSEQTFSQNGPSVFFTEYCYHCRMIYSIT